MLSELKVSMLVYILESLIHIPHVYTHDGKKVEDGVIPKHCTFIICDKAAIKAASGSDTELVLYEL